MFKCYKCIDLFDSDDSLFTHLEREHYVVKMENGVSDDDNMTAAIEDMSYNSNTIKTGIYDYISTSSKDVRTHAVRSNPSSNPHHLVPDIGYPGNSRTPDATTESRLNPRLNDDILIKRFEQPPSAIKSEMSETQSSFQSLSTPLLPAANGSSKFVCGKCDLEFTMKSQLMSHVSSEHNEPSIDLLKADPVNCLECGGRISSHECLNKHILLHKTNRCMVCGKIMSSRAYLHVHLLVHSRIQ
eukprot:692856_1